MSGIFARRIADALSVSGSPDVLVRNLSVFGQDDWKRAQDWLDQSGLALGFWDRVKRLGAEEAVPREIRARLERIFAEHRLRVAGMAEEFDSINRSFERAGIEYAVLKGFALTPEYAPDARLRTAYDYDYLLSPDSLEQAAQPLSMEGYVHRREDENHSLRYTRSAITPRLSPQSEALYSPALERAVELHTRLWDPELLMIPLPLPNDFLARRRLRHWQGLSFYSLAEEDELTFQVLHAFRHILTNWCRLSVFLEIARFLAGRASDSAFWGRFWERIRNAPPLPEMTGVVFSLAARLFGATLSAVIDTQIMQTLPHPLRLWVDRYGYDSALANLTENKYALFLHREFVPDEAAWQAMRRKRLLPLQRPNRAARASSSKLSARLAAGWKQAGYVVRRFAHHSLGDARYLWESRRWERLRNGS